MCSIWKILHLREYFYTGTAHGARNNYQVCFWMRRILSIKSAFQSHHRFLFQKQIKEYSIGNVKVWHLTYMVNKMVNCRGMKHGVKVVGATNTMGRCQVNKYSNVHHARYQTLPVILWCRKNVCFYLWGKYLVDCSAVFIAQHCLSFLRAHWRPQWDFSHQRLSFRIPQLVDIVIMGPKKHFSKICWRVPHLIPYHWSREAQNSFF